MGQVYDFFSSRNINDISCQDYVYNDEMVSECGKYVGVLTKTQTKVIKDTINLMIVKKSQIEIAPRKEQVNALLGELDFLWSSYEQMTKEVLGFLGTENFGVEYHPKVLELYVDTGGHCWVVRKGDREKYRGSAF